MTQIEVILLSLLYDKDYYGYELESVIQRRNMRGWTNIGFSSIYNSLSKLEKNGHIISRYEKEHGSPKRKVYSINDEAKLIIKEQIIKMIYEYKLDATSHNIGMFFSYLITKEELLKTLISRKENLIERKELFIKKCNEDPPENEKADLKMLFQRTILFINTEISWLEMYINNNF
ncbi:PadR family transcriptional regulator [Clostridium sp.]|uniref:PadR family transcriptional regulator n=1 Tax=Clostridium sp. TaxID=1506 RepID=UPI0028523403|nr:PadR family transcriptional regulator [Clostridium sp.]MDR3596248.1 PadR family transcriptional regulator [Clostridium sp.]